MLNTFYLIFTVISALPARLFDASPTRAWFSAAVMIIIILIADGLISLFANLLGILRYIVKDINT